MALGYIRYSKQKLPRSHDDLGDKANAAINNADPLIRYIKNILFYLSLPKQSDVKIKKTPMFLTASFRASNIQPGRTPTTSSRRCSVRSSVGTTMTAVKAGSVQSESPVYWILHDFTCGTGVYWGYTVTSSLHKLAIAP